MKKIMLAVVCTGLISGCTVDNEQIDSSPENEPVTGPVSENWSNWLASREVGSDLKNPDYQNPSTTPLLTNFSYAGYQWSEKPIPTLESTGCSELPIIDPATGYTLFNVTDYGAIADDNISDQQAIRDAIAEAERAISNDEVEGVVLQFPEGRFRLNEASDMVDIDPENLDSLNSQPIRITESNFIVRGCGSETDLHMSENFLPLNPSQKWTTPRLLILGEGELTAVTTIQESIVGGSTKQLVVGDASELSPGDWIEIKTTLTAQDKIEAFTGPYKIETTMTALQTGLILKEIHLISEINGNTLTLKTPIQVDINSEDNWVVSHSRRVENVGVEHITFSGNWQEEFVHHESALHDSGWSLLTLSHAAHSWVNNVTFVDFNQGLNLSNTVNSTVSNVTFTGNTGHLSLQFEYSFNNLAINVRDEANTFHAPGFSHLSSSNVQLDTWYESTSSPDLHGVQPRMNLFDRMTGGWIYGRWGAAKANQPNHLSGLVFWNPENTGDHGTDEPFELMRNSEYGRVIIPTIVGLHGNTIEFASQERFYEYVVANGLADYDTPLPDEPQAYLESNGESIEPSSLFLAQLQHRLTELPEWLQTD